MAVLVLLIVGGVVVYYAYQSGTMTPPSPGVSQEQESVKNTVENFIRESAYHTLKDLSQYGGFLEAQKNSVEFQRGRANYWMVGGQKNIPNLKENFISGVRKRINGYIGSLEESLKEKNVTLKEASVSANILGDEISLTVNLPTYVRGYPVQQPYQVEIPTKIGDIYEFSKAFLQEQSKERYFEYFTLSTMFLTSPRDMFSFMYAIDTNCDDPAVHYSWEELSPEMEGVIKATLAKVYMPGKAPENTLQKSVHPKYSLSELDGKGYKDLEVSFHLPEEFALDREAYSFQPDPVHVEAERTGGICVPSSVTVNHSLRYTTVAVIRDPFTQNLFRFAFPVDIKGNEPGEYKPGYPQSPQAQVCGNMGCKMDINTGVEGASVYFRGCYLGKTDGDGSYSGLSPCGFGELKIEKRGYESYSEVKDIEDLQGVEIQFKKLVPVNVFLYEVKMVETESGYGISKSPMTINPVSGNVSIRLKSISGEEEYDLLSDDRVITTRVAEGDYIVTGMLTSALGGEKLLLSQFTDRILLEEEGDLYIYFPREPGLPVQESELTAEKRLDFIGRALNLSAALKKCGIGPVSTEKYTLESSLVYDKITGKCS